MKILATDTAKQALFMGIDVHDLTYRVSLFFNGEELENKSLPSEYHHIKRLIGRHPGVNIHAVYEAGAFGYDLYDRLKADGVNVIVTSPSLIPRAPGDKVKTDKRDSRKLAQLLSMGALKAINVPDKVKREEREVLRTRDQLVRHRRAIFQQIESKIRMHALQIRLRYGITKAARAGLLALQGLSEELKISFTLLLDSYDALTEQLKKVRAIILALCEKLAHREAIRLLKTVPGIGQLTALSFLLELPSMKAFKDNDQLASFLGMTASEHSSGDTVRQGRITKCGNTKMRWMLVESSWMLIGKDGAMRAFYERIKRRRGSKRAIVAVARKLSGKLRAMLLKGESYALGTV